MTALAPVELCEDTPRIGRVVDIVEQVDGLLLTRPSSMIVSGRLEGHSLLRKERTSSEACTVPSLAQLLVPMIVTGRIRAWQPRSVQAALALLNVILDTNLAMTPIAQQVERRAKMSRQLLLDLNGNNSGLFLRWLNAFDGEPRIAWYPSSGEDFRDLLYLNPRYSDLSPATRAEPRHPDIFLHTDYFPWERAALLHERVIYDDLRTVVERRGIEELPRCNLPIDPGIVDFPEGGPATGRVVFLDISVTSEKLGSFSAPVVYAFVENEAFCARKILAKKGKMSHVIHVRYGGGAGGGGKSSGIWLLNVLRKIQCECFVTDSHHHRQTGDQRTYGLYPDLSGNEDTEQLEGPIRTVSSKSWSCNGCVSWKIIRPA